MSRSLISVVQTFEGCNDNFLDSLSVLCHEVSVGRLLLGAMLSGQCCIHSFGGSSWYSPWIPVPHSNSLMLRCFGMSLGPYGPHAVRCNGVWTGLGVRFIRSKDTQGS